MKLRSLFGGHRSLAWLLDLVFRDLRPTSHAWLHVLPGPNFPLCREASLLFGVSPHVKISAHQPWWSEVGFWSGSGLLVYFGATFLAGRPSEPGGVHHFPGMLRWWDPLSALGFVRVADRLNDGWHSAVTYPPPPQAGLAFAFERRLVGELEPEIRLKMDGSDFDRLI